MKFLLSVLFISVLFGSSYYAQDVLYNTSGGKIQAKVLEVNVTDIKYKDATNLEGPTYVISKNDIVLITYANGKSEIINANPPTISPQKNTESTPSQTQKQEQKKPLNLYYMNNNLLSINALALANGDITLMYDRSLLGNHLGISFLGGYNFNSRMGGLNAFITDSRDRAKKKFDVGLGVNFFPNNEKRVQYFIGVLAKYMAYDYDKIVSFTSGQNIYEKFSGYQFNMMVTNGWVYRISPDFNFKLFGSFGLSGNYPVLKEEYEGLPKVYLGYCFGYRF